MATKFCEQFHEWYTTPDMGDTCVRQLDHDGHHKSNSGYEWPRTATERKLAAEVRRLQRMVDGVEAFINEVKDHSFGRFLAEELVRRMEKHS